MNKYTLITGASSGIGLEMAKSCAELGRNVLMISLPNEQLKEKAESIALKHNVLAQTFECNLTTTQSVTDIYNWVVEGGYEVDFLINNAGFGGTAPFESHSLEYIENMLALNNKAMAQMVNRFLPMLKQNQKSHILNVASLIAGQSAPFKSLYTASKTFVKNFSISLSYELESEGVMVSVLLPGATPTNEVVRSQIENGAFVARVSVMSAEDVARVAVKKALAGKRVITTSNKNGVIRRLLGSLPNSVVAKLALNQRKKLDRK